MSKANLKLVVEDPSFRKNLSKGTAKLSIMDQYSSIDFLEQQAKDDQEYIARRKAKSEPKSNLVWILMVTYNRAYQNKFEGLHLEGAFATEEAIDTEITRIKDFHHIDKIAKLEQDLKV